MQWIFAQRLQAQHLASFWYFTSARSCALIYSFRQALEASSQTVEEQQYFAKKLREFKWALKVDGEAGAVFMKTALGLIEHSRKVVTIGAAALESTTSPIQNMGSSYASTSPSMNTSHQTYDHYDGLQEHDLSHQRTSEVSGWSFDDTWDFNNAGQSLDFSHNFGDLDSGMG